MQATTLTERKYIEARLGGFSWIDGSIEFHLRINVRGNPADRLRDYRARRGAQIDDAAQAASELLRVTKPGGYICALTLNTLGHIALASRLAGTPIMPASASGASRTARISTSSRPANGSTPLARSACRGVRRDRRPWQRDGAGLSFRQFADVRIADGAALANPGKTPRCAADLIRK